MTPWAKVMADRQAAGLCRACGKPQAPGCALCEFHRDRQRERRKAAYYARKIAGKCIEPACERKPAGGHIRCRKCHAHFLALADPNRLAVLMALTTGALGPADIARASGVDQPGLTHHLRQLKEAGLIVAAHEKGRARYSLAADGILVTPTTLEFTHASGARASFRLV